MSALKNEYERLLARSNSSNRTTNEIRKDTARMKEIELMQEYEELLARSNSSNRTTNQINKDKARMEELQALLGPGITGGKRRTIKNRRKSKRTRRYKR